MGKKGKKRPLRKMAAVSPECHMSTSAQPAMDSIEDCLAEFEEVVYQEEPSEDVTKDITSVDLNTDNQSKTSPTNQTESLNADSYPLIRPSAESRQERLAVWDRAFQAWNVKSSGSKHRSGNYSPGLLPCFETELARHFQMQKLSKFLLGSCRDIKMPAFERWLLDSKLEERQHDRLTSFSSGSSSYGRHTKKMKSDHPANQNMNDPVLPRAPTLTSESSKRLIEEICETGTEKEKAHTIVKELLQRTKKATQEICSQSLRAASQTPFKSDRIDVERGSYLVSMLYSRKKWKSPFIVKINIAHYNKLKARFLKTHAKTISSHDLDVSRDKRSKALYALHLLLMVITLRYSSFSGGQLLDDFRGGGMQGAINEQGFTVLKEYFPSTTLFECFASPLNVSLPMFASAFEELDWHFGSVGDLALCTEFDNNCCCEANPPFTPGYTEFLSDWIRKHMAKANSEGRALTFAVIVPAVHEKDLISDSMKVASAAKRFAGRAHQQMVKSRFCTHHILLRAKEHGYVEGAQHLRPTRYKRSLYDTSVIILQSKKAQEMPLDKEKLESSIRVAFAERHSEEHQKRVKEKHSEK